MPDYDAHLCPGYVFDYDAHLWLGYVFECDVYINNDGALGSGIGIGTKVNEKVYEKIGVAEDVGVGTSASMITGVPLGGAESQTIGVGSSVGAIAGRYRLLSDINDLDLTGIDDMTLQEAYFIIYDS